jgi:hypothetical protein
MNPITDTLLFLIWIRYYYKAVVETARKILPAPKILRGFRSHLWDQHYLFCCSTGLFHGGGGQTPPLNAFGLSATLDACMRGVSSTVPRHRTAATGSSLTFARWLLQSWLLECSGRIVDADLTSCTFGTPQGRNASARPR